MATTTSTAPPQIPSTTNTSLTTTKPRRSNHISLPTRRHLLFLLTVSTTTPATFLTPKQPISRAEDIPLFGLRKTLRKAEQETEEIVRESFEAAEKGIVAAEKGVKAAEKGVEAAAREIEVVEREVEGAVSFGGLAQAGLVAGAEVLGVVVASAVVNGILGPEAKRS